MMTKREVIPPAELVAALDDARNQLEKKLVTLANRRRKANAALDRCTQAVVRTVREGAEFGIANEEMAALIGASPRSVRGWRHDIDKPSPAQLGAIPWLKAKRERILANLSKQGEARRAAQQRYKDATSSLAETVREAAELGLKEIAVSRLTKVPRSSLRVWLGKQDWVQ